MSIKLIETRGLELDEKRDIENLLGFNRIKFYEISSSNFGYSGTHHPPDAIFIKDKDQHDLANKVLAEYFENKYGPPKKNIIKLSKPIIFLMSFSISVLVMLYVLFW